MESYICIWAISILFGCLYSSGLMHGLKDSNGFLYLWNIVYLTLLQMSTTLRPLRAQKGEPVSAQTRNSYAKGRGSLRGTKRSYRHRQETQFLKLQLIEGLAGHFSGMEKSSGASRSTHE